MSRSTNAQPLKFICRWKIPFVSCLRSLIPLFTLKIKDPFRPAKHNTNHAQKNAFDMKYLALRVQTHGSRRIANEHRSAQARPHTPQWVTQNMAEDLCAGKVSAEE